MILNSSTNFYVNNIKNNNLSIYDAVEIGDPNFWIPSGELQSLLNNALVGVNLEGLPLRTRSKVVKEKVCIALGYPIPKSFKKTNPRFIGQNFDTYIQKSNNLQIWNEEISPSRRYVLIQVSDSDIISKIKVINGAELSVLDTTGKLTSKYQAILKPNSKNAELVSTDTETLKSLAKESVDLTLSNPAGLPEANRILSIESIYCKLSKLVGKSFVDTGFDQERNRGAELHRLICQELGYSNYRDNGQFPDIRHQLLEVKLQTSPTIDLGAIKPDDENVLDMPKLNNNQIRPLDVRYAIFFANISNGMVNLTHFYITSGQCFFNRFPQMLGKQINKKLQIPLPPYFFD